VGLAAGKESSLSVHASAADPVAPIGLVNGTGTEKNVAQGTILGNALAVRPKVSAYGVVRVGEVHYWNEEDEPGGLR
jgi:hypothetical protein